MYSPRGEGTSSWYLEGEGEEWGWKARLETDFQQPCAGL